MPDIFTKAKRSDVMSRIRSRGNADTELALVWLLRAHGITGWRRQRKLIVKKLMVDCGKRRGKTHQLSTKNYQLTVTPDFVFFKQRVTVFVDGCFWHGCPQHGTQPKGNASFWRKKFAANQTRDALVNRALRAAGWRVIRIWEHELKGSKLPAAQFPKVGVPHLLRPSTFAKATADEPANFSPKRRRNALRRPRTAERSVPTKPHRVMRRILRAIAGG